MIRVIAPLLSSLFLLMPSSVLAAWPRLSEVELRANASETAATTHQLGSLRWFSAMLTLGFQLDSVPSLQPRGLQEPALDARTAAVRRETQLPPSLVRRTLEAAYRAAGLGASEASIRSALTRARLAALLPEVRLRGAQYAGLDSVLYEPGSRASSRDQFRDTRTLEARLGWRLDRLVYGGHEPTLERLRTARVELRLRLTARVVEALRRRHRALYELAHADPESSMAEEAGLSLAEAEAMLDALTNGDFSRSLCRLKCE